MFRSQALARLGIVSIILLLIDIYAFQGLKLLMRHSTYPWRILGYSTYWSTTIFTLAIIIFISIADISRLSNHARSYVITFIVLVYLAKIVVALFLLINDITRVVRWAAMLFSTASSASGQANSITRYEFLNIIGWITAAGLTGVLLKGMWNIDRYKVRRITLKFPHLPIHMSGYKFVQISDIHTGSYTSEEPLKEAVAIINKLEADTVFFTGDLVNNSSNEAIQYIDVLKQIKVKNGVYSITGNHDYGDYNHWDTPEDKSRDVEQLFDIHKRLGWRLLLDENIYLDEQKQVVLIGVQNISGMKNFHSYGDFNKAIIGTDNAAFRILLSHDPTHWDTVVNTHTTHIDLTLAGHTHGMQFGINIPGYIKWSPSQWIFKRWMGLYTENKKHLYVNTGLGFLGYPGRVGILPEITLFELIKG